MAKRKILENWKAIEEKEKQVQEETGDPKAGFNASTIFLGTKEGRHLMIPCIYGGNKEMNVFAEFCPFTGKPLYEEIPNEETK